MNKLLNLKSATRLAVCLTVLLVVSGCEKDPEPVVIEVIDVGLITDANIVPTSFNESIKATIKTGGGVFLVRGMPSVLIGEAATVRKYDNGRNYLCVESWGTCRALYN